MRIALGTLLIFEMGRIIGNSVPTLPAQFVYVRPTDRATNHRGLHLPRFIP